MKMNGIRQFSFQITSFMCKKERKSRWEDECD